MRVAPVQDNAPCPCGNNKTYADCHKAINEAWPNGIVNVARKLYLDEWGFTSQHLFNQGGYNWAARQLAPYTPNKIFDVGCGVGYGLSSIISEYPDIEIIAIDENGLCLDATAKTLEEVNSVTANKISRMESKCRNDGFHINTYRSGLIAVSSQVTLIESDFFKDEELSRWLHRSEKFDAITVWLCGTHKERQFCYSCRNINNNAENRLWTQNMAYELADQILKIGGALHILDRVNLGETKQYENEVIRCHQEQAEPTTLRPVAVSSFPYDLPTDPKGISFIGSLENNIIQPQRIELQSVISVKS